MANDEERTEKLRTLTVSQLIERLSAFPPDAMVLVSENGGEYDFMAINGLRLVPAVHGVSNFGTPYVHEPDEAQEPTTWVVMIDA